MYKLKAAPKKEAKPTTKAIKPNIESELIKIKISPAKLGVGGAAILATLNKNHHKNLFKNLFNLRTIYLHNNELVELDKCLFKGLTKSNVI